MDNLLTLNLKEEWRMLTSYFSGEKLFFVFPIILFGTGVFMSFLIPLFRAAFDMRELVVGIHLLLILYGLFVGAFGFFADEVAQTWFGDARLLIHMYAIHPVSFRYLFTWFYIKDIVYYLGLTLFPLYVGGCVTMAIPWVTFCVLVVSLTLSFLLGVSISFIISAVYMRKPHALIGVVIFVVLLIFSGISYQDFPPINFYFTRSAVSLGVSAAIFSVLSVLSLAITTPVERRTTYTYTKSDLFSRVDPVMAKELIDVKRSGTWRIIITSYLFPLLVFYGIFYFSGRLFQMDLDISLVFYGVFLGYLSTLVYSWLNNIDPPLSLGTLPVSTSYIIQRKIILFLVSSFGIAVVYLLVLGYILKDILVLPLAVFAMGCTTFYVAAVTAWLCGLNPNTKLFDGTILVQYLGAIMPVLVVLSILSFMKSYIPIVGVSAVILGVSYLIYMNLNKKYEVVYLQ
ncbi:MAG: hypothetical protein PVF58_02825 [Candidatus Methanofastidiosia archaeon]|jgi:hypothetical protein